MLLQSTYIVDVFLPQGHSVHVLHTEHHLPDTEVNFMYKLLKWSQVITLRAVLSAFADARLAI